MLSFSQSDGVLHLAFAGLDYGRAGQLRYRYRLEGIDKDWVGPDTLGMATYSSLPPGEYRFRAEVGDSAGHWSRHALAPPISITPDLWNSRLAWFLYLVAGTTLLLWYLRTQRQRRQRRQDLLNQISEREERLKLALWGSGDEFWDWDLRKNSLYRIGADQLLGDKAEE